MSSQAYKPIPKQTPKLKNLPPHKLINSKTYHLKNSQTYKPVNLKIFYKIHIVRHPLLAKIKPKNRQLADIFSCTPLVFSPFLRRTPAFCTILPF